MRKLIVTEWMTLDGVVQAPGDADEDTSSGFRPGGWHLGYFDDISRESVVRNLTGQAVSGKRIFTDDGVLRPLRLMDLQPTTTGAVLATCGKVRD